MLNKNIKKYLQLSIYFLIVLAFASSLVIFKTWIFPFITSKAIPFRICVELLGFAYVILMLNCEEYRPKKSWITYMIAIFTLIAIITSIFGINPYLSFAGDLERMWGINQWLHLILFFFVVTNFLKTKKQWFVFFNFILLFATIVASVAYLQMWKVFSIISVNQGLESLLGNIAYVAGLLLLGVLISLYYLIEKKEWWWRLLYSIHIFIQLPILIKTQIRGAHVALYLSILILSLVFIFKSHAKKVKLGLLLFVLFFITIFGLAFANKGQDWVKTNPIFGKMASISVGTGTVRTRLISWNSGYHAFLQNPIMGYGMENYYYAFDKFFPGSYYSVSAGETWFDRAHNMVVETLVAHGIFGLISYLLIFVITLLCLYKTFKMNKEKNFLYYLFFSCIVIAYFIQNFFVFDSLAVTSVFFFILAYVNFRYTEETNQEYIWKEELSEIFKWTIGVLSGLVLLYFIFGINFSEISVAKQNYMVQRSIYQDNDFNKSLIEMKKLYDINSYLNKDSTTMLTDTITTAYTRAQGQEQIQGAYNIINYLIEQYDYYLDINDKEAYMQMNLARLYIVKSNFFAPNSKDSIDALQTAKSIIQKSIDLSPERLHNYYFMANIEMALGNTNLAAESLQKAIKYNDKYGESYLFLGNIYKQLKDPRADEYIKKAIELDPALSTRVQN